MRGVLFAIFLFALSACGFHLRGMIHHAAWMQSMDVQGTQNSGIINNLNNLLPNSARHQLLYHLFIDSENFNQQLVSVGAGTNPRQYLLEYTVQFHLIDAKGKIYLPESQIHVVRQITINNEKILGSNEEERTIQNEMRNDAASQMILRLSHMKELQ